ncbi:uncharacterized protein V1516DRAFT_675086 [Lipomyces oligophaga]|uniref:uncharacterized protein n=1 Tax=Lipomyces oligophaga TaxID=45792 RepID=UPI0034CD8B37
MPRDKITRVSLEEFHRRASSSLDAPPSAPAPPSPAAPILRKRIEKYHRACAKKITATYRSLFFSDLVDQHSTPIQRFFPESLFDLSAHTASPLLASSGSSETASPSYSLYSSPSSSSSGPTSALASLSEWLREIRRVAFLRSQAESDSDLHPTKLWDDYTQAYSSFKQSSLTAKLYNDLSRSQVYLSEPADVAGSSIEVEMSADKSSEIGSSVSPAHPTAPTTTTTSTPNSPLLFSDRAYPAPSADQYAACKNLQGMGVWDSFGVWRCLLRDPSSGAFPSLTSASAGRLRLFDQFESYLEWKISQSESVTDIAIPDTVLPQKQDLSSTFPLASILDSMASSFPDLSVQTPSVPPFSSTMDVSKSRPPSPNAKVVGKSQSYTSSIDQDGSRYSASVTRTFYDDGSFTESVDNSPSSSSSSSLDIFNSTADSDPAVKRARDMVKSLWPFSDDSTADNNKKRRD